MCFWYLPDYIRRMEDGEEKNKALHKVGSSVKTDEKIT